MIRRVLPLVLVSLLAAPGVGRAADYDSDPDGLRRSGTAPAGAAAGAEGGAATGPDGIRAPVWAPTIGFEDLSLVDWLAVIRALLPAL